MQNDLSKELAQHLFEQVMATVDEAMKEGATDDEAMFALDELRAMLAPDWPDPPFDPAEAKAYDDRLDLMMAGKHRNSRLVQKRAKRKGDLRPAMLKAIVAAGDDGMTADEAGVAVGEPPCNARPMMTALKRMKYVVDSGRNRPSSNGAPSAVWVATGKARAGDPWPM